MVIEFTDPIMINLADVSDQQAWMTKRYVCVRVNE